MVKTRFLSATSLVLATLLLVFIYSSRSGSTAQLRRVTNTSGEVLNLNPSLSGDGLVAAFESTANLTGASGGNVFRAIRADLSSDPVVFTQISMSRAVTPAVSQDGSRITFASNEDPLGTNPDRNSEIFLFNGSKLQQITRTTPDDPTTRIRDGCLQPSITDDGRIIAFASNRNLTGQNADLNFEVFIFDVVANLFTQLTHSVEIIGSTGAKISGDGSRVAFIRDHSQGDAISVDLVIHECATGANIVAAANRVSLSMTYGRAISDEGSRIVFADQIAPNQSEVFLFDARTRSTRQVTSLGARAGDVPLHATISGDGKRITFATRRNPLGANGDRSVELFLHDLPSDHLVQITSAPAQATAEVVSSLNDDGSVAVFSFPRVLSGPVSSNDLANNSEIYTCRTDPRPAFGTLTMLNAASLETESSDNRAVAPESIAVAKGSALANQTEQAKRSVQGVFPLELAGTTVAVNGRLARLLFVSPDEVHFVVPPETEIGSAEVVITNVDGFPSKTNVSTLVTAPGLFTLDGDGSGEGVILNADTLVASPFDPTNGQLRLIIFATGTRGGAQLSVTTSKRVLTFESQHRSLELPGLDEIHVLVPSDLRGAGTLRLTIAANNRRSNPVDITFSGSPIPSPSPSPSPSPTPSPSATPSPSPSPQPSPSPTPTPLPSPTPAPSPSPTPIPSPSPSPGAGIVISQVYGGGGNSGAPFRNDFIEIFNAGEIALSLAGWSVQYATATGTSWSVTGLTPVSLAPGQYYLIQEATGGNSGLSLPAPDISGNIAMAATAGKVALVNTTAALTGACPSNNTIVDLVGYGTTASCFRGNGPTPAPSNTTSVLRKANGCTDTRNNSSDFATGPPTPRNTMSALNLCTSITSSKLVWGIPTLSGCAALLAVRLALPTSSLNLLREAEPRAARSSAAARKAGRLSPRIDTKVSRVATKIVSLNSQRMYIPAPTETARGP